MEVGSLGNILEKGLQPLHSWPPGWAEVEALVDKGQEAARPQTPTSLQLQHTYQYLLPLLLLRFLSYIQNCRYRYPLFPWKTPGWNPELLRGRLMSPRGLNQLSAQLHNIPMHDTPLLWQLWEHNRFNAMTTQRLYVFFKPNSRSTNSVDKKVITQ
jgi:hypothetical protein